jgi:hypothetical protein
MSRGKETPINGPHRIRLRGPWQVTALECADPRVPLPQPARMHIPCSWADGGWPGFRGRANHARSFGRPSGLGANERIRLIIEMVSGVGQARLNQQPIGAVHGDGSFECDVTGLLAVRNLLEIDLSADGDWGGVVGEVRIEIHSSGHGELAI